jgi:hypothetical protein
MQPKKERERISIFGIDKPAVSVVFGRKATKKETKCRW